MDERYASRRQTSRRPHLLWVAGVLILVGIVAFRAVPKRVAETDLEEEIPQSQPTLIEEELMIPPRNHYRDGSYIASGSYVSPAGSETVFVALGLEEDVISWASFNGGARHPTSKFMQKKFQEGFSDLVVGKRIDEVALTVVNGSSLTPKGFMEALEKIQGEAQA